MNASRGLQVAQVANLDTAVGCPGVQQPVGAQMGHLLGLVGAFCVPHSPNPAVSLAAGGEGSIGGRQSCARAEDPHAAAHRG